MFLIPVSQHELKFLSLIRFFYQPLELLQMADNVFFSSYMCRNIENVSLLSTTCSIKYTLHFYDDALMDFMCTKWCSNGVSCIQHILSLCLSWLNIMKMTIWWTYVHNLNVLLLQKYTLMYIYTSLYICHDNLITLCKQITKTYAVFQFEVFWSEVSCWCW